MPNIGDVGGVIQPLRTIDIALPTPRETLLGTPEALPTTEPGTSQISYTIQASDLPVLPTGLTCKYTATIVAGGKNTDVAGQTVSYRVLKNGVSVATATSGTINTNNWWNSTHSRFYDVIVGDVLECRMWASDIDVNWDYRALYIYPTRIVIAKTKQLLTNVEYTLTMWPVLTLGNPVISNTLGFVPYNDDLMSNIITTKTKYTAQVLNETYKCGRINYGDMSLSSEHQGHPSSRPYYRRNYVPTTITFNPTPIIIIS